VAPRCQPIFRELGIDAEAVFTHELIKPWRSLPDRQNCTLDANVSGKPLRWHVKRYAATHAAVTPAENDVAGQRLLADHAIPTADLIAWGRLDDGRSFVILDDLTGYTAADKLVERGLEFDRLLQPSADLAAKLHDAGLHHRDLYLCHFFARLSGEATDLKLIDPARVRRLPRFLRRRWIVKDLAQFWYSTTALPVTEPQREAWLSRYAQQRKIDPSGLRPKILRKVRWIARHDERLRRQQPSRNVSIPTVTPPSPEPPAGGNRESTR
jgi:hypothetical protein